MAADRDYVLGTHDEEIARLAIQHRVWRHRALEAWMHAGLTVGQTLVDLGCGPGYAAFDLAEITGPSGKVVAIDRSRRFLDAMRSAASQRDLRHIEAIERDFDSDDLPAMAADGVWVRWVFAFCRHPQELLKKAVRLLKPGGTIVIHEYFDYATWRFAPPSPIFDRFVAAVMESWRAEGGEPDIALELPHWLHELGMTIRRLHPIIDVATPDHFLWQWPSTFVSSGTRRLVELGRLTAEEAEAVIADLSERAKDGRSLMFTPAVLEIIAQAP